MKNRLFLTAITITISLHWQSHTAIANDEFFEDEDFLKLITEVEEKKHTTPPSSASQTEVNTLILPADASNDKDSAFAQSYLSQIKKTLNLPPPSVYLIALESSLVRIHSPRIKLPQQR
jgi:hypothetical protein